MRKRRICGFLACLLVFGLLTGAAAADEQPCDTSVVDPIVQFHDLYHWAAKSIAFVVSRGLMVGMSETSFEPDRAVNWAMVATVFGRITLGTITPKDGVWYSPYTAWAVENRLMRAEQAPLELISRENLAGFLAGYLRLSGEEAEASPSLPYTDRNDINPELWHSVAYVSGAGLMQGRENGQFAPHDMLTRAELSVLLQRVLERGEGA